MKKSIIVHLQQYQSEMNRLVNEIQNDEMSLSQKRSSLEQYRGAFSAMMMMAQEHGLVDEQGQIIQPETTEAPVEEDAVEVAATEE